jgi:subtilase family protein
MSSMESRIFTATIVILLVISPANAQTRKNGPMAKVTQNLAGLYEKYIAHLAQRSAVSFSSDDPLVRLVDDRVVVDAVASGDVEALKADLVFLGMDDAVAFGRIVSGHLPITAIPAIAGLTSLQSAQSAVAITNTGNVTSQGDLAMRSGIARTTFGVDGTGIKVGVLSDSFNCKGGAAGDVASNDLSPVTVLQEDPGCSSGTDEGRAMLQIVHDVAPGSSLAFATADGGQANFANNIVALKNNGAKIITDDVMYPDETMFQDGIIAQAVDQVVAAGAAYFSAAGNQGRRSYESAYRAGASFPSGNFPSAGGAPPFFGGRAHDFGGGNAFQRITLANGQGFIMSFQWDSPAFRVSGAPGSQNDMDVYLFNAAKNQVVAGSVIPQAITRDPIEVFAFVNTTGATADFNIMLVKFSGANPKFLKYVLFSFGGTIQEFATDSSTIFGHANAVGAEAVGAVAYFNTPPFGVSPPLLNSYSSAGGTPILFDIAGNPISDSRASKPEIVAPDCANTTFFVSGTDLEPDSVPNFCGTSAAAPHAAAVAALLLQAKPGSTPAQIYNTLEGTAIDMGAPGFDNDSGFGFIQADATLAATPSNLSNISTRGSVLTDDNVMIGGFIIEGAAPKKVLIRARGPALGSEPFNVPAPLANPFVQLFSGSTVIAQNDDWQTGDPLCTNMGFTCGGVTEITASGLDPCQPNPGQSTPPAGCSQESVILITLPPGAYTAIVTGIGGGTGVGLVEVFDVDSGSSSKLANISTRGIVQTGDNVMIGGFIIGGSIAKTVLVRGRGPALGSAPFNVPGTLANPFMQLFSGSTVIAQNDNWQTSDPLCGSMGFACGGVTEISATGLDPCQPNPGQTGSPAGCAQESVILITLPPGAYTAILSGVSNRTGVGLVEVFKLN